MIRNDGTGLPCAACHGLEALQKLWGMRSILMLDVLQLMPGSVSVLE